MHQEEEALAWLARRLGQGPPGQTWVGDDAAVVPAAGTQLLLAADAVVGGVHADLNLVGLHDVGWKSVSAAVSDMAAMGGRPTHLLVTAALPPDTDLAQLFEGITAAAAVYGSPVVGGDLVSAPVLMVSVAVTGAAARPVLRSGARPGHRVWVTGALGASAAGLRALRAGETAGPLVDAHRRPVALIAAGEAAAVAGASAMIDLSDGLALDAHRLARASSVGMDLDVVPRAVGATPEEAVSGGEDYQLLFSAPADADVEGRFAAGGQPPPLLIGACTDQPGIRLEGSPLAPAGWQHSW
ncbi:MAG TPA: thiamine-phosphate kinase [Acidimicrobiales bacterium]|nr:thiamine-phosphate kinase [Acidimicrobiales bacterium]